MKVHLFGAVSSPSCSNYALRKVADDSETTVSAQLETLKQGEFV